MRILLVTQLSKNDEGDIVYHGVEYHRMTKPHAVLERHFPEYILTATNMQEFNLDSEAKIDFVTKLVKEQDLVLFNREIPPNCIELLNEICVPYGLDLDDYWYLPGHHELREHYDNFNIPEKTENSIRNAHFVIVTTPILAEKVQPFNKNVYVIENGIDSQDEVWQPRKVESPRMRFGFTQGSTHFEDIKTLFSSTKRALKDWEFRTKGQIVLCGFQEPKEGDIARQWRKVNVPQGIECLMTDSHSLLPNLNHVIALQNFQPFNDLNEPYRRILAKPVLEFAKVYDEFDVSVAPLKVNTFNSCKSELKMLEAGFKGCAIMLSHVKPYTLLATNKNSFDLCKNTFREIAVKLIKNPNLVKDSASQLREDVDRYDLNKLVSKRNDLYKKYKK